MWLRKRWAARRGRDTDGHRQTQRGKDVRGSPCSSVSSKDLPAVLAANGALSLLNLCIYLLGQQLKAQAKAFEEEGGFTERLYKRRTERRQQQRED